MKQDLTIKELSKKATALEGRLRVLIHSELEAFKKDTGISPNAIYVSIVDTTTMGRKKEFVLGDVRVEYITRLSDLD